MHADPFLVVAQGTVPRYSSTMVIAPALPPLYLQFSIYMPLARFPHGLSHSLEFALAFEANYSSWLP